MEECTKRFNSDYDYQTFKTYPHLQTMVFAHIHEIKSLRTLEIALNTQQVGVKNKIRRSTISDANKKRSSQAFFWLLEQLMSLLPKRRCKEIEKVVRILDSSPIQLRGRGFDEWSKQYATRHIQGLKLHLEYDLALESPVKTMISHPNCNDATIGQMWPIEQDTIYVFDKGYYDFNWWWSIHESQAFFVTRLKKNAAIVMIEEKEVRSETILEDGTFQFKIKKPRGRKTNLYKENLRRVSVKREGKSPLILVTNLRDLSAEKIGELYKARWEIELFFKWIKQNLKIKKYLGRSVNAVKIQLATALIAYLLVQIFKINLNDKRTLYLVITWMKFNFYRKIEDAAIRKQSPPIYHFQRQRFSVNREPVHL